MWLCLETWAITGWSRSTVECWKLQRLSCVSCKSSLTSFVIIIIIIIIGMISLSWLDINKSHEFKREPCHPWHFLLHTVKTSLIFRINFQNFKRYIAWTNSTFYGMNFVMAARSRDQLISGHCVLLLFQWNTNTHALLNSVISNDLEWVSKIFSDTKRRAVSLRQQCLLYCRRVRCGS